MCSASRVPHGRVVYVVLVFVHRMYPKRKQKLPLSAYHRTPKYSLLTKHIPLHFLLYSIFLYSFLSLYRPLLFLVCSPRPSDTTITTLLLHISIPALHLSILFSSSPPSTLHPTLPRLPLALPALWPPPPIRTAGVKGDPSLLVHIQQGVYSGPEPPEAVHVCLFTSSKSCCNLPHTIFTSSI